ncbi:hypothetical protein [Alkalibacterium sp.]|nr:MAG: hypothetical protein EA249_06255 [Alkalibacterium sp.]
MNNKWIKLSSVALLSLYLAACDNDEEVLEDDSAEVVEEEAETEDETAEEVEEEESDLDSEEDSEEEEDSELDTEEDADSADSEEMGSIYTLDIEGMDHHYHTGELVELTAVLEEDSDYNDWHWYMREDEDSEWEIISGQGTSELMIEAPESTVDIRAALYDDSHDLYAESDPIELEVDNH